jgi:23S rRNA-/tRNA-specific pseudouridylate synthase
MRPWASPVIIDECDQWMIIDKPALMAAHPSKPTDRETLWHHLCDLLAYERINGGQVSLINRLDRETSGLTLVAKTRASARSLCRQMEAHHIQKSYQALVHGWPERTGWTVDAPIARKGAYEPSPIWLKQTIHPEGSSARTRFENSQLLKQSPSLDACTRFGCTLHTADTLLSVIKFMVRMSSVTWSSSRRAGRLPYSANCCCHGTHSTHPRYF